MIIIRYTKIRDVKSPERGTVKSAGIDFFIPEDFVTRHIGSGENICIPSGIKMDVPEGFVMIFFNKSGVAAKLGLDVGACVIDEDYQGEIHLDLHNISPWPVTIIPGQKIIQGVFIRQEHLPLMEIETVDELFPTETARGEGGFGSTGEK